MIVNKKRELAEKKAELKKCLKLILKEINHLEELDEGYFQAKYIPEDVSHHYRDGHFALPKCVGSEIEFNLKFTAKYPKRKK